MLLCARTRPTATFLARALTFFLLALSACSAPAAEPALSVVQAKPMPDGRHWQGIYQGPYHVYLRILTQGDRAQGDWQAIGERNGDFEGTVSGNLLRLSWTERGGASGSWSGRGYFVYEAAGTNGPDEIHGEWGIGSNATGNSWWALRRADVVVEGAGAGLVEQESGDQGDEGPSCGVGCDDSEINPD